MDGGLRAPTPRGGGKEGELPRRKRNPSIGPVWSLGKCIPGQDCLSSSRQAGGQLAPAGSEVCRPRLFPGLLALWRVGPMGPECKVMAPDAEAGPVGASSLPTWGTSTTPAGPCRGAVSSPPSGADPGVQGTEEREAIITKFPVLSCPPTGFPAHISPHHENSERGSRVLSLRMKGE